MEERRLFFGLGIETPWPERFPQGRLIDEVCRHMTVAFVGNVDYQRLSKLLPEIPPFPFKVGLAGWFDDLLFLPSNHPRVVAWHIHWFEERATKLDAWQRDFVSWFQSCDFYVDDRKELLPHVTICRAPFIAKEWKSHFSPLPLYAKNLHLFESKGNLNYQSLWSYPTLRPAFEELEHTADIAYRIYAEDFSQLLVNAFLALSFKFPPLLPYFALPEKLAHLDEIVFNLNEIISKADENIGCPLKAVSFHGDVTFESDGILSWEMIVDV